MKPELMEGWNAVFRISDMDSDFAAVKRHRAIYMPFSGCATKYNH
ncbi:hypothetical protein LJR030_004160 [Rhizobium sp. LjRoot30]